jgi:hypothetical protein
MVGAWAAPSAAHAQSLDCANGQFQKFGGLVLRQEWLHLGSSLAAGVIACSLTTLVASETRITARN